jgi:protocatechuate 3,4-dioxygenase beta subunit
MVTSGGNKQVGTHGTQLPKALQVTVADQYGNGVPNVTVNFSDNGAGGTFSNPSPTTGSQGSASTLYTLPGTPGTWTIAATSGTLQVSFTEIGH